jgi:hypothetical protein
MLALFEIAMFAQMFVQWGHVSSLSVREYPAQLTPTQQ